jgi:hypothetical protein
MFANWRHADPITRGAKGTPPLHGIDAKGTFRPDLEPERY